MLTISQLAGYVGVTVRAVRHYHQRGLLAEPERDASGYRRYGADAVINLIRIKTLADAGVPLARIDDVLAAGPAEFSRAIAGIDAALEQRIRDLRKHRQRIAALDSGDALILPAVVVGYLARLRAIGASERIVELERGGWILLSARSQHRIDEWIADKQKQLDDPEFRDLYLACDQAFEWDPADPRLERLAGDMAAYAARIAGARKDWNLDSEDMVATSLLSAQAEVSSPGWRRLNELCAVKARAAGIA
jgi:DNA-binding transcriptional MerR regulator